MRCRKNGLKPILTTNVASPDADAASILPGAETFSPSCTRR